MLCPYTWMPYAWHWLFMKWPPKMKWPNEITAKIDHVPFTCNCFIVLQKWAHKCKLFQKRFFENISKFQQILATAMEPIFRKGSFLKLVNVFWKRTLPQLFFYIATENSQSIHWSGEISHFQLFHSLIRRDFSFSFDFS